MEKENCHTDFTWIKSHAGTSGNYLAEKDAKGVIINRDIYYKNIPINEIARQESQKTIFKWQKK